MSSLAGVMSSHGLARENGKVRASTQRLSRPAANIRVKIQTIQSKVGETRFAQPLINGDPANLRRAL